jgi:hypothetical protein
MIVHTCYDLVGTQLAIRFDANPRESLSFRLLISSSSPILLSKEFLSTFKLQLKPTKIKHKGTILGLFHSDRFSTRGKLMATDDIASQVKRPIACRHQAGSL